MTSTLRVAWEEEASPRSVNLVSSAGQFEFVCPSAFAEGPHTNHFKINIDMFLPALSNGRWAAQTKSRKLPARRFVSPQFSNCDVRGRGGRSGAPPGTCTRKRAVIFFGWALFLISSGSPHVRCTPMGRTCGEPDEIGLTPMGVELNGSGRVRHPGRHVTGDGLQRRGETTREHANGQFDFVWLPARVPHVGPQHVWCA